MTYSGRQGFWWRLAQAMVPGMIQPRSTGAEQAEVSLDESADPIVRYDIGDDVDPEHYPDGVYWRFRSHADKRITVRECKVAEVVDVVETREGRYWLRRTGETKQ